MTDKLHIADTDLALYAMGALDSAEMQSGAAHLADCAACREELRQITVTLAAYAQATIESPVPDGARGRFMARVAGTPQVTQVASHVTTASTASASTAYTSTASLGQAIPERAVIGAREPAPSFWSGIFGSGGWSLALAGAMGALLVAAVVDDVHQRNAIGPLQGMAQRGAADSAQLNQLMTLLTSNQARRVSLHTGSVKAPPPEGRVVYTANDGKLLLTASNLTPLPAGKVYELWILQPDGKKPLPAGTFAPDNTGNASMVLASAPAGLNVAGFGVTIENQGGSETPTLPIVLSGL